MGGRSETPGEPHEKIVKCSMCQRLVPAHETLTRSGQPLCFGCLSVWYDEEETE